MITQLEIKNFRGFSEYKIEDVGQVNLLVGTNNCGKTSILEAIDFLKSKNTSELFSIFARRGEYYERKDNSVTIKYGDLCRLFYGFRMMGESCFKISSHDNNEKEIYVESSIEDIFYYQNKEVIKENSTFKEFGSNLMLRIYWGHADIKRIGMSASDKDKTMFYAISNEGEVIGGNAMILSSDDIDFFKKNNNYGVEYIPPYSITKSNVIDLFNNIVLTDDEEFMLDAIRIIDPSIVRLAQSAGRYGEGHMRGGFFVKSSKWEERIPIGSFGDGIWRLLGLALSLVAAKNGILLIDEIDTGLHYTVMSKMWKLICVTAKKLNVQVFATTHSRDCWETLADNAIEDEFADMSIRIHRINKDKKQATTFTNREMHLALNRELEVR